MSSHQSIIVICFWSKPVCAHVCWSLGADLQQVLPQHADKQPRATRKRERAATLYLHPDCTLLRRLLWENTPTLKVTVPPTLKTARFWTDVVSVELPTSSGLQIKPDWVVTKFNFVFGSPWKNKADLVSEYSSSSHYATKLPAPHISEEQPGKFHCGSFMSRLNAKRISEF